MVRILIKIHPKGIVSLCDENLIGKTFETKTEKIEIIERFFKGEARSEDFVAEILEATGNATIVGKNAVEFAVKRGFVDKNCVKKIGKVPVACIFAV
ncbi:MAG: DUF424 family protein [Candidatus Nanoarchaeia archaeon]|nr:DUF424 family protein [Candidatus Nanoarchaeia archaeon]